MTDRDSLLASLPQDFSKPFEIDLPVSLILRLVWLERVVGVLRTAVRGCGAPRGKAASVFGRRKGLTESSFWIIGALGASQKAFDGE